MQVDIATAKRYQTSVPELLDSTTGEGDERLMKRDALTDYCVKFDGGLCGIQKKYGADFLSDACYFYPRMTRALADQQIMSGALSCPEIARLALANNDAFALSAVPSSRMPGTLIDYTPEGLTHAQCLAIHEAFIARALDASATPARNFMRMFCVAQSLEKIPKASWPDAVPFYLEHADSRIPAADAKPSDAFFILQALCGIIAAAKKGQQMRLMDNVRTIEAALHVNIQWDNLAIAHMPDSQHAASVLEADWQQKWQAQYGDILRRYLAAQLSLALFPFAGLGDSLTQRMAIIGVRFATVRLALMSACRAQASLPTFEDCVRIIQSLSRLLDHLAGADFSLSIYQETGWLEAARLRAIVGDSNS